jgi:hypothetical protein
VAEQLVEASDGKYQVGERWGYRTRPGEEASFLTVLKVESSPRLGVIVHVRVDRLRIRNPQAPDGVSDTISHVALAEAAMDDSVTTRLPADGPVVGQDEVYEEWRRAFDDGTAGIWTVTVADAIGHIAHALNP